MTPEIFIPHYWTVESNSVCFYVDDFKVARILANLDRTIDMPNGFKLTVKVRNGSPPFKLDAAVRERMKLAMAKRYIAANKALDLSQFHLDTDLRDIYCGLSRAPILSTAVDIIVENIAELEALKLDGNKIYTLDPMKTYLNKLPNLKILHVGNNKVSKAIFYGTLSTNIFWPNTYETLMRIEQIGTASALELLRNTNIIDLELKGNPICNRLRDEVYVRYTFMHFQSSIPIVFYFHFFQAYGWIGENFLTCRLDRIEIFPIAFAMKLLEIYANKFDEVTRLISKCNSLYVKCRPLKCRFRLQMISFSRKLKLFKHECKCWWIWLLFWMRLYVLAISSIESTRVQHEIGKFEKRNLTQKKFKKRWRQKEGKIENKTYKKKRRKKPNKTKKRLKKRQNGALKFENMNRIDSNQNMSVEVKEMMHSNSNQIGDAISVGIWMGRFSNRMVHRKSWWQIFNFHLNISQTFERKTNRTNIIICLPTEHQWNEVEIGCLRCRSNTWWFLRVFWVTWPDADV